VQLLSSSLFRTKESYTLGGGGGGGGGEFLFKRMFGTSLTV
jgi:hypothetical protein